MARVAKEYSVRRKEILDAAQRLVYTRGYELMTIQDILCALGIAKGTFFHYFSSKQALLEALVERMLDEVERIVAPVVEDPDLPALEKLRQFNSRAGRWKTDRKDFFLALLRVWYADDNAIVRQKVTAAGIARLAPMISTIVEQGIREGVMTSPYPRQSGEVVFAILQGLGDAFALSLLTPDPADGALERVESTVAAYNDALERVLGAPAGSVELVDAETLREWFDPSRNGRVEDHGAASEN